MRATIVTARVVPQAKRDVATSAGSPAAAYSLKNGGNTATMTVVQNAEFAQSYIAQLRSSLRWRPRPASRRAARPGGAVATVVVSITSPTPILCLRPRRAGSLSSSARGKG